MQEGQTLLLDVETLSNRGQGICRVGLGRWVVFVYGALPSEEVEVYLGSLVRLSGRAYHPGRNYYKIIPWNIFFCNNFCNYCKNNSTRIFSL